MIELVKQWAEFAVYLFQVWPASKVIAITYPVGWALGFDWTQRIKRSIKRSKRITREKLTRMELQCIASFISGSIIGIVASAFFAPPLDQLLVHMLVGGAACPLVVWIVICFLEWKFPTCAKRVKTAEERAPDTDRRQPNGGTPDPNTTGQWWKNR